MKPYCHVLPIVPVNHVMHSLSVVYHLYGEWSSKGQIRTASSSVLLPSLPHRLQVGLKHHIRVRTSVLHRNTHRSSYYVGPVSSCSLLSALTVLQLEGSRVVSFLVVIVTSSAQQHCGGFWIVIQTIRGAAFSHMARENVVQWCRCFLPSCLCFRWCGKFCCSL